MAKEDIRSEEQDGSEDSNPVVRDFIVPQETDERTVILGGEVVDFAVEEDEDEEAVEADSEVVEEDGDTVEGVVEEESDDDVEVVEEDEAAEGVAPDVDEADSAEAPTAEATDEEDAPVEEAPELEPLTFKADGTEFQVSGRKDDEGNLVIAPDEFQRAIQPRLADRGAWQREREAYRREIVRLSPDSNPEVLRAREVLKAFTDLLDKGPDAVIEWAEKYDSNKDALIAKAEAAAARREAEALRNQGTQQQNAERQQQLASQLETGLDNVLDRATELEQYANLDKDHLRTILTPMRNSIFFIAQQDMPEAGISRGEIGVNLEVIEAVLKAEAARQKSVDDKISAAAARKAAAKRNAAATGKSPRKAPPVAGKKSAANEASDATPARGGRAKTRDEWNRKLSAIATGR